MMRIRLARTVSKGAPGLSWPVRFDSLMWVWIAGPVDWSGKGPAAKYLNRWAFWTNSDPDGAFIFGEDEIAEVEAPDTPAWRALFAVTPHAFTVQYVPPTLHEREPDGNWCLPPPPAEFALGDTIRLERPAGYAYPYPPAWEGVVIEQRFWRMAGDDYSYRLRVAGGGAVNVSQHHASLYGCRLVLVQRAVSEEGEG